MKTDELIEELEYAVVQAVLGGCPLNRVDSAKGALRTAIEELAADRDKAVNLLDTIFHQYEEGVQCYEDPEDCTGYLGNAVRLDDDDFHAAAELLNRLKPREST